MVEPPGMGVLEGLGDVPHQLQALTDVQRLATVTNQVIQADRVRVIFEQERGTPLGVLVVLAAQDAGVLDAFEHGKLTLSLPDPRGALLWTGGGGRRVNAHSALHRNDAEKLWKNSSLIFQENVLRGRLESGLIGQKPAGSRPHGHIDQRVNFYTGSDVRRLFFSQRYPCRTSARDRARSVVPPG